ncbi:MAG: HNH endonuclease [Candidatus Diapherotrites archaeon]|nr:HNH endonuclease [Candidatus Diapherotrites archaeon]
MDYVKQMRKEVYGSNSKKPRTASAATKELFWDTNPHICHICGKEIFRISDSELDHVRAYAKGGTTLALSHRGCNRYKSDKQLAQVQKELGVDKREKKNWVEQAQDRGATQMLKRMGLK